MYYRVNLNTRGDYMFIIAAFAFALFGFYAYTPVFALDFTGSLIYVLWTVCLAIAQANARLAKSLAVAGTAIVVLGAIVVNSEILRSSDYRALIGEVKQVKYSEEALPPIDIKNAPLVSYHMANQVAQKKLAEIPALGSQVVLGHFVKQKINGKLYWVSFLEQASVFTWFTTGSTPGYIKVSATDPNDVDFVTQLGGKDLQMKYLPSSYLGDSAYRRIYFQGNKTYGITDLTGELDEEGRPFITASLYTNMIGTTGPEVVGVAVLDVQTGDVKSYNLNEIPAWVDRVHPEYFVEKQLLDWGEYVNGWFNPSKKGKLTLSNELDLVYGEDGQAYFYAGVASVGSDNGVIGFTLTNTRTKQTTLHLLPGANEAVAASAAVDIMPEKKYHATNPLPFSVNGVPTYIMTLTDDNGIPRAYGMVSIEDYQTLAVSDSLPSVYKAYLSKLSRQTGTTNNVDIDKNDAVTIVGQIVRINAENKNNNTNYYFTVEGSSYIIQATSELNEKLVLTRPGDTVSVQVEKTENKLTNAISFDNISIK